MDFHDEGADAATGRDGWPGFWEKKSGVRRQTLAGVAPSGGSFLGEAVNLVQAVKRMAAYKWKCESRDMRVASVITLTSQERRELEKLSRGARSSVRARERSRVVLLAADGLQNKEIARRTGMDRGKVGRWRQRLATQRLAGILKDKTRPAGKTPVSKALRKRIVGLTLHGKPPGATHLES